MKYYNIAMCFILLMFGCFSFGILRAALLGNALGLAASIVSVLLFLNPIFEVIGGYLKSERTQ